MPLRIIFAVLVLFASTPLWAQNRIDARQLDCRSVQFLIIDRRAVVLTTGQHTYDRYVVDGRFCASPDVPRQTYIHAADTDQCPVYRCGPSLFDDWD